MVENQRLRGDDEQAAELNDADEGAPVDEDSTSEPPENQATSVGKQIAVSDRSWPADADSGAGGHLDSDVGRGGNEDLERVLAGNPAELNDADRNEP